MYEVKVITYNNDLERKLVEQLGLLKEVLDFLRAVEVAIELLSLQMCSTSQIWPVLVAAWMCLK